MSNVAILKPKNIKKLPFSQEMLTIFHSCTCMRNKMFFYIFGQTRQFSYVFEKFWATGYSLRLMQVMDFGRFFLIRIVQNYLHFILPLVIIDLLTCHMVYIVQARYFRSKLPMSLRAPFQSFRETILIPNTAIKQSMKSHERQLTPGRVPKRTFMRHISDKIKDC